MATESIEVSGVIHAPPDRVYKAWLDSGEHTAMTGGAATIDPNIGGHFSAWGGYIEGSTLEIEPGRRIVQKWRTTEFPMGSGDSTLEVRFEPIDNGTRVTFVHSEIPEGQATRYEQSWREQYLQPMARHFGLLGEVPAPEGVAWEGAKGAPVAKPAPVKAKPKKAAPSASAKATKKVKAKPSAKKAAARKAARKPRKAKKSASRRGARKAASKKSARKAKGAKKRSAKRSARRGRR
jgi:uncharacterized protein YndB with AHSA1/START domain